MSAIPALTASSRPKLMAEHRNGDNRLADGSYKKFRNQALGTARNPFFLQPRYPTNHKNPAIYWLSENGVFAGLTN